MSPLVLALLQVTARMDGAAVVTLPIVLAALSLLGGLGIYMIVVARWTATIQEMLRTHDIEIKDIRIVKHDHDGRLIKLEAVSDAHQHRLATVEENVGHLEKMIS